MELDMFSSVIRDYAKRNRLSFLQAHELLKERLGILESPVPEIGRLSFVENLLAQRTIGAGLAELMLRKNPLGESEIRNLAVEIRTALSKAFSVEFPTYEIVCDPSLRMKGGMVIVGRTDPVEKRLYCPDQGDAHMPLLIAHETGHAYQIAQGDAVKKDTPRERSSLLREGWPLFVEEQYALIRDASLGLPFYQPLLQESLQMTALLAAVRGPPLSEHLSSYERGLQEFHRIAERDGLEGAVYAATHLTTDDELREY